MEISTVSDRQKHPHALRLDSDTDRIKLCWSSWCSADHVLEPLFIAHKPCWAVARASHDRLATLFHIAHNTRQMFPPLPRFWARPVSRISPPAGGYGDTPLGELLGAIARRLPVELQDAISTCLDTQMIGSIARASKTATFKLKDQEYEMPWWHAVPYKAPATSLNAKTSHLFGLLYISKLSFNEPGDISIPLESAGVRGFRFAIDSYGLRAIRVLYDDQSTSPWLGDPQSSWYGEIFGSNLEELSVISDVSILILAFLFPSTASKV